MDFLHGITDATNLVVSHRKIRTGTCFRPRWTRCHCSTGRGFLLVNDKLFFYCSLVNVLLSGWLFKRYSSSFACGIS